MTTENPNEGNLEIPKGEQGTPTPVSSEAPTNLASGDLAVRMEELTHKLNAQDGEIRALKKGKDKAVDRFEQAAKPLLERLATYLGANEKQVADAQRAMALDDLVAERFGGEQQPERQPAPQVETGQLLTNYGLDPNDPAIAPLLAAWYQNPREPEELELKLARIARGKINQPVPPAPPAPVGGKPPGPPDAAALTAEYKTAMLAARGKRTLLASIRSEYAQKGVDVHNIDFT